VIGYLERIDRLQRLTTLTRRTPNFQHVKQTSLANEGRTVSMIALGGGQETRGERFLRCHNHLQPSEFFVSHPCSVCDLEGVTRLVCQILAKEIRVSTKLGKGVGLHAAWGSQIHCMILDCHGFGKFTQ